MEYNLHVAGAAQLVFLMTKCTFPRTSKPCPSCPWRVDQTAADIPHFSIDLAEGLVETSPDARGFGPGFQNKMFACHRSPEGEEFACAGWLAMVGHAHPRVRVAVMEGRLPVAALRPGNHWPELHETYGDVLAKLRATVDE